MDTSLSAVTVNYKCIYAYIISISKFLRCEIYATNSLEGFVILFIVIGSLGRE